MLSLLQRSPAPVQGVQSRGELVAREEGRRRPPSTTSPYTAVSPTRSHHGRNSRSASVWPGRG